MTVWIQITWKVEKDPNEKYRLPFPWAFDPDSWQLKNIESGKNTYLLFFFINVDASVKAEISDTFGF